MLIAILTCIAVSVALIVIGSQFKKIPLQIVGWVASIISVVCFIIRLILVELGSDTLLLAGILPTIMLIGFVVAIVFGVCNLANGYKKDEQGKVNMSKIITGWSLIALAVVSAVAIVLPLTMVFDRLSSNDTNEIRFM